MTFSGYETLPGFPRGTFTAPEPQAAPERSYEAQVRIFASAATDGPAGAYDYVVANVAALGDTYVFGTDFDNDAYLVSIDPQRVAKSAAPWVWIVTLRWRMRSANQQKEQNEEEGEEGQKTSDPTLWKADIKTGSIKVEEVVEDAKYISGYSGTAHDTLTGREDGGPVVNSALQPFDPPSTRRRSLTQYSISTYVDEVVQSDLEYRDTVNDDEKEFNVDGEVYTIPQYAGYCEDVTFESTVVNEKRYYRRNVVIVVDDEKTWRREYLDRGKGARAMAGDPDGHGGTLSNADLPTGSPKTRPITNPATDDPVTEPVLLNGDGQPNDPDADPIYAKWQTIPETSWSGFALP